MIVMMMMMMMKEPSAATSSTHMKGKLPDVDLHPANGVLREVDPA